MVALLYDSDQWNTTNDEMIVDIIFPILNDMLDKIETYDMFPQLPRNFAAWSVMTAAFAGDIIRKSNAPINIINSIEQSDFYRNKYTNLIQKVIDLSMINKAIDESPFNITLDVVKIIVGIESFERLFTAESNCGGEYIEFPPGIQKYYYKTLPENTEYVKCTLIALSIFMFGVSFLSLCILLCVTVCFGKIRHFGGLFFCLFLLFLFFLFFL